MIKHVITIVVDEKRYARVSSYSAGGYSGGGRLPLTQALLGLAGYGAERRALAVRALADQIWIEGAAEGEKIMADALAEAERLAAEWAEGTDGD